MIPERLLHYRIIESIGAGGMGHVYLAEDSKLGRRVALKVLRDGRSDDLQQRHRFEREAKAIAALSHPNIVTIHAVEEVVIPADSGGQAHTITFLTMELVEGKTLSELLPKGGLPLEQLIRIAIPLTDAVAAAHARGITHRDLKPANIMLTADGRVKVLDFGLAKLQEPPDPDGQLSTTHADEPLTGEGRIVGTVAYMSPEQAEGKLLDHRSDIFSLGVLLYEMATGERPFRGDTSVSVIAAIVKDTPPSVTEVNKALPRDLARIVKRALVKDPDHRYQSAKDLRNDLETFRDDLESGELNVQSAVLASATPGAGRQRSTLAAIGFAVLILCAVAVWFLRPVTEVAAEPFRETKLARLTNTGGAFAAVVSADGRYVAHVVSAAGKQSLWLRQVATSSNVEIVKAEDVRYDGISFSRDGDYVYYVVYPRGRGFSVAYRVPVLGGTPRQVIDDVDTPLEFSPDGKQIAFLRGNNARGETALMIASVEGSNAQPLIVHKQPHSHLLTNIAWSPDGLHIAALRQIDPLVGDRIVVVEVASGEETPVGAKTWAKLDSVAWLPDGRHLIIAGRENPDTRDQIWIVSYPDGAVRSLSTDLNGYSWVSVSADGRTVAAIRQQNQSHIWTAPLADPDNAVQITSGVDREDGPPAWTPDGRIVYQSNASGNVDIWITDAAGTNSQQLTVHPARDSSPIVSPDGRSIFFYSTRAEGVTAWQMDIGGGNQRPLFNQRTNAPHPTRDGKWIYYSTRDVPRQVWRVASSGGDPERLTGSWPELGIKGDDLFYHPTILLGDVSPDGNTILASYADAELRGWRMGVFPLWGGAAKRLTQIDPGWARWTPDGQSVLYRSMRDGVDNLFLQPLAGGIARQVTHFTNDGVREFELSVDGKQLVMSRATETSDVVLLTDLAK